MSEHVLQAESREATGKEQAKKMRQAGKVPGVFYAIMKNLCPYYLMNVK